MKIYTKDILRIMQFGLSEIKRYQLSNAEKERNKTTDTKDSKPSDKEVLPRMLSIMLHLMSLMNSIDGYGVNHQNQDIVNNSVLMQFRSLVYELVKLDVRSHQQACLLHMACSDETTHIGRYPVCSFPAKDVVKLLLMVDADPNCRDQDGNTPLHIITRMASSGNRLPSPMLAIISMLLEHGAHVDMSNSHHWTPLDHLKPLGRASVYVINPVRETTLKCLSAQVLTRNNLAYQGLVDPVLEKFVNMH